MLACYFEPHMKNAIMKYILSTDIFFRFTDDDGTVLFKGHVRGTTGSGLTLRTTFGNSFRQLLYLGFVADEASIPVD